MIRPPSPRLSIGAIAMAVALVATSARADGVTPEKATAAQRDQAQSHFTHGRELYGQGQYARALEEFQASRDIIASPNAHLYAARSLRELGRLRAAYLELERTANEARALSRDDERYAKTADAADQERQALAAKVGFVKVTIANANDGTVLRVAGEEVPRSEWNEPIPAPVGSAEVVMESPDHRSVRQNVDVTAGQTTAISLEAAPATTSHAAPQPPADLTSTDDDAGRKRLRLFSFVAAGVGAVGLGTFAVFGAMSNGKYSTLEKACASGPCPPSRQSDIDAGKRDQTIANVGLVVGLLGAATAVTLFVLSTPNKSGASSAILVGPNGAGIGGEF